MCRKGSILRREPVQLPPRVERLDFARILKVPEGPAVATGGALQLRAQRVDRAVGLSSLRLT